MCCVTNFSGLVTLIKVGCLHFCINFVLNFYRKPIPEEQIQYCISEKKDKRAAKAHVNAEFFRQLRVLLSKYNMYLFLGP